MQSFVLFKALYIVVVILVLHKIQSESQEIQLLDGLNTTVAINFQPTFAISLTPSFSSCSWVWNLGTNRFYFSSCLDNATLISRNVTCFENATVLHSTFFPPPIVDNYSIGINCAPPVSPPVQTKIVHTTYCGNVSGMGIKKDVPADKSYNMLHIFTCLENYQGSPQQAYCQADATWNLSLSMCIPVTTSPPSSSDPTTNSSTQTSNQTTTSTTVAVSTPSSTTDVTAETTMPVTDSGTPESRSSLEGWEVALVVVGTCAGITIIVFVGLFFVIRQKHPDKTVKWKICAVCTCVLCVGGAGICETCGGDGGRGGGGGDGGRRKNSSKVSPTNSQSDMTHNAKHV